MALNAQAKNHQILQEVINKVVSALSSIKSSDDSLDKIYLVSVARLEPLAKKKRRLEKL